MFGWGELGLILLLALILLGPDNMVDVARKLGKLYGEYKKARRRLELEIMYGLNPPDEDILRKVEEIRERSIMESVKENLKPKPLNNADANKSKGGEVKS